MKTISISLLLSFFVFAISAQERKSKSDTLCLVQPNDSTEYELIIFDVKFESWFLKNKKPKDFYSLSYYELKNQQYISYWNSYYMMGKYSDVIENYIDYDRSANYGLDLEFRLYYYFKYVENVYSIKLH